MNEGADHSLGEPVDLTAVEHQSPDVPPEVRERLLRRVEGTLGIPGSGAPDPTDGAGTGTGPSGTGSAAPGAASLGSGWTGIGAAAALATLLVGAVFLIRANMGEGPLRAISGAGATVLGIVPPEAAPAPVEPVPAPAPSPSAAPAASEANRAGAPTSSAARDLDLAREHALLEAARSAVSRGQGGAALASLDEHARAFPGGRLAQEREVLTIQALMQTGRHADARARGESFRRRFPKSMLLPVVDAALGTNP
jgi:hypothetical protein